jgi:hypothetical protein
MFWILLAILIIVGWIIYLRRKGSITLTKGQAEVVGELIRKEKTEIEKKWSDSPGCFERHLQRREGNLLFPSGRRIVTRNEIEEAREKDRNEQKYFFKKISELGSQMRSLGEIPIGQVPTHLRNIQSLMEEAASIGGEALNQISNLEKIEDDWLLELESALPENKHDLESLKSLSGVARNPYMAQRKRKDTPIIKEEEVPALLSEDLETISGLGYMSRALAPNFRPNEADITSHLEKAVSNGFSKERAAQIIAAWKKQNVA